MQKNSHELIIKPENTLALNPQELWEYRELLYFLVWRDIKVRYKQTLIGIMWAVLQPFITMIVFTFVFNRVAGISSGTIPYAVFSFSGLIFWNYFSSSITDASNSLIASQSIITKVFFPRILIPFASTITPLVDFFFSFLLLLLLMVIFRIVPNPLGLLAIIPALLISLTSAFGIGLLLATLNVKYRDVRYALPFFIQLLLFVTPVIYPLSSVPKNLMLILYLNPMTGVIELVRNTLIENASVDLVGLCISLFSTILLLLIGITTFKKYERKLADII